MTTQERAEQWLQLLKSDGCAPGGPDHIEALLAENAALTAQVEALREGLEGLKTHPKTVKYPPGSVCIAGLCNCHRIDRLLPLTPADALKRREREDEERRLMERVVETARFFTVGLMDRERIALEKAMLALEAHRKESEK